MVKPRLPVTKLGIIIKAFLPFPVPEIIKIK